MPEHRTRRLFLEVEEVELLADPPVVALLGLLEPREIGLELLLVGPGRAVDPLQHLVARIAAPVGARDLHQLEGAELARGRHVRAAAEVEPVALAVEADLLARRDGGDDLGLVVLAQPLEGLDRLVARHHAALDRQVRGGQLLHPGFEFLEVLGGEGPLVGEVVVEAVLDHRADRDLRVRVDRLHGLCEQVGGRVAEDLEAFGVLGRDDGDRGVAVDQVGRVDQAAVDLAGERGLCEAGTDVGGELGDGQRLGIGPLAAVGQRDDGHGTAGARRAGCGKAGESAAGARGSQAAGTDTPSSLQQHDSRSRRSGTEPRRRRRIAR